MPLRVKNICFLEYIDLTLKFDTRWKEVIKVQTEVVGLFISGLKIVFQASSHYVSQAGLACSADKASFELTEKLLPADQRYVPPHAAKPLFIQFSISSNI